MSACTGILFRLLLFIPDAVRNPNTKPYLMSVKKLCCFFLVFFSMPAFSQEEELDPDVTTKKYYRSKKTDEKTNLAFALGEFFWSIRKLPEAKKWYKTCLYHTPDPTDSNNVVNILHLLANVYLNEAVYDSALFYCNASFAAIGRISNKIYLPNLYQTKGRIYLPLGDLQSAVNYFTIADSLYQISPEEKMQSQSPYTKIALGQIFQNQHQMGRAKEYYDLALQISRQHSSNNTIASSIQTVANWQSEMKQYAAAKENYLLLMRPPYFKATSYRMIYTYTGLGDVYLGLKKYDSALYYYKLSMYEAKVKGEVYQQDLFYRKLGDSYLKLKDLPLAKVYYDSSIWWGKKNNKSASTIISYQALSEIATTENDYKTAYRYMQLKEHVKDSVLTIKNLELSNNLYTLNNLKQKDVAINQLTATNVANDKKIKKSKTLTNFLFGFVGIMGLVFLFFTNRMQLKRKLEKQLAITGERERIIADLHDDVGATLSSIHIYSELAGNIIETKKAESKDLMNKISQQGKALSSRMSDIIWSLKPVDEGRYSIINRVKNYSQELLAGQGINTIFDIDEELDNRIENPQVRKNILLVTKEAMNNIAKYSKANTASISLRQIGQSVILSIADDGIGFDQTHAKEGNGLHNMLQRSKQIKGACDIISSVGKGTRVECIYPIAIIRHTI